MPPMSRSRDALAAGASTVKSMPENNDMDDLRKELAALCLDDQPPRSRRGAWVVIAVFAAAAVIGGLGPAAPAAAHASVQPAATVYTMTPERIAASTAIVVALIGAVVGGLALARFRRIG